MRVDARRRIDEGRLLAHPHRPGVVTARMVGERVDGVRDLPRVLRRVGDAGAVDHQRTVVAREALGEPELAAHIRVGEVEGLERGGADALDVPRVEELVRDRAEQLEAGLGERVGRSERRGVAVLHPVAGAVGSVAGDEGVAAEVEAREAAVDGGHLVDDALGEVGEARGLVTAAEVIEREANRLAGVGRAHLPLADVEPAEVRRRVHEVLQVRRAEGVRIGRRFELRGDAPGAVRRDEGRVDRSVGERRCVGERGRDVEVCACSVDAGVGAVGAIGEQRVCEAHRAAVAADPPHVGTHALDAQRPAIGVRRAHRIDVLGEIVRSVAARRAAGHPHFQRTGRHRAEGQRDFRLALHGVGKRDVCGGRVARGFGRTLGDEGRGRGGQGEQQGRERAHRSPGQGRDTERLRDAGPSRDLPAAIGYSAAPIGLASRIIAMAEVLTATSPISALSAASTARARPTNLPQWCR